MLVLGGFDRKNYRLRSIITHRGGHNSGHYETFRRQVARPVPEEGQELDLSGGGITANRSNDTKEEVVPSSRSSALSKNDCSPLRKINSSSATADFIAERKHEALPATPKKPSLMASTRSSPSKSSRKQQREKKTEVDNKWWRISDDRANDCKTKDVLAMQKEAYLLFYERID